MKKLFGAALLAACSAVLAQASNTAPTRTFTIEWICANGRALLVNAHPRRPREVAHVTYNGVRVSLHPKGPASEGRHVSDDGRVAWVSRGIEGQLSFEGLLAEPVACVRKTDIHNPEKK